MLNAKKKYLSNIKVPYSDRFIAHRYILSHWMFLIISKDICICNSRFKLHLFFHYPVAL